MTIHPIPQDATPQDTTADSLRSTVYDTVWTGETTPTQQPDGFERMMVADGKINVVLAVVLIIWLGILVFLFYTDRKIDRLERRIDSDISDE